MSRVWSQQEVEAVVDDYLDMLASELGGEAYDKTEHRRRLAPLLDNRSDGAIERKRQNISAAMLQCDCPFIQGYKPLSNYQQLLFDVVCDRLRSDPDLAQVLGRAVDETADLPPADNVLDRLTAAPNRTDMTCYDIDQAARRTPAIVNYFEREARNASLGRAGELFALTFERARLRQLGRDRLAERVDHVSVTVGDGLGYDIRSFESDGRERMIEVKTTAYGNQTPFFLSRRELEVSSVHAVSYHLYRVFWFRRDPRLVTITGAIDRLCRLTPVQFVARI